MRSAERAIYDILAVRPSQAHPVRAKCHRWQFTGAAFARVATRAMEAPRRLTGAGHESDEPLEILARSEAGDDGRLRSRRPGAGDTEKAALPRSLAIRASAPRLNEAARAGSGGRHGVDHPHPLPRDRRRRETGGRFGPHGSRSSGEGSPRLPDPTIKPLDMYVSAMHTCMYENDTEHQR